MSAHIFKVQKQAKPAVPDSGILVFVETREEKSRWCEIRVVVPDGQGGPGERHVGAHRLFLFSPEEFTSIFLGPPLITGNVFLPT